MSLRTLFSLFIFITKSDIQIGGETEKMIFCPIFHSPSDLNSQCCADPKPGARNFLQVSQMGAESHLQAVLNCFPRQQAGSWMESGAAGIRTSIHKASRCVQGENFGC